MVLDNNNKIKNYKGDSFFASFVRLFSSCAKEEQNAGLGGAEQNADKVAAQCPGGTTYNLTDSTKTTSACFTYYDHNNIDQRV